MQDAQSPLAISIKEFKYQYKKNPSCINTLGVLLALETTALWQIHPLLSLGVNIPLVAFYGGLMVFGQQEKASERARDYKDWAFNYIEKGNFEQLITHISTDEYQEADPIKLRKQNSDYLFTVLNEYHYLCSSKRANNYLRAAEILLTHAESATVLFKFRGHDKTHKGLKWLEMNQANHKFKIP